MFCSVFILFYFFHSVQQNLWCVSCTNTKKTKHPELNKVVIECVIWLEFTVASAFVGRLLRTHSSQTTMWSAVHSFTAIRFRAYIHFHFQFYVYLSAISTSRNLTPTHRHARNRKNQKCVAFVCTEFVCSTHVHLLTCLLGCAAAMCLCFGYLRRIAIDDRFASRECVLLTSFISP